MDDWVTWLGVIPLAAAVSGAVSWVVARMQIRAQLRTWQRTELRGLVADFWGACDRLSRHHRALAYLIAEIQAGRAGRDPAESERLESERTRCFAGIHENEEQAGQALAIIRILFVDLADAAQGLYDASSASWRGKPEVEDERRAARAAAREAFEAKVRTAFDR